MTTLKASPGALIPLCALALLLFLASAPAEAQLPPAIQADRLLVRAEREIQERDYAAAAATLEQIVELQAEHGLEVPEAYWFKRGQVAQEAGLYQRAMESATRYLEIAGQQGEHYRAALELLDAAEQAIEAAGEDARAAAEKLRQVEQEVERRKQQAEREIRDGDYAAAAATLEQVMELQAEHGLEVRAAFWFQRAQVALQAGHYEGAIESATRYLEKAGQEGESHSAALALRADAEQLSRSLSRFVSQWESRMVVIPTGSFRMGCRPGQGCLDNEIPLHEVTIRSFALSKHEVTLDDWDACVRHGGCSGYRPDDEGWGRGDRPVINVSWEDAQSFVAWLSRVTGDAYRLPTEAEWEYAARADAETEYSWGNRIGRNQANCDGCRSRWDNEMTAPVGSFVPNGFGMYDMHGNVSEWVEDCWNDNYVGAPSDGSAWLGGDCERRVLRGGSWGDDPMFLESEDREWWSPGIRLNSLGFRVARTLTP